MKIRKTILMLSVLALLLLALSACTQGGDLPKPPVGGGSLPMPTAATGFELPATAPPLPSVGATPGSTAVATPSSPATPDWQSVKSQASAIQQKATEVQPAFQKIADAAAQIKQNETDPNVRSLASQIADLAAQAEQDAAQIAVTASDINYRIDHSEATTLRLSDDIGKMADRIGEMADRILWTEGQIGVMADRIVHSEHLINDGTQQTIDQIQETLKQITDWTNEMAAQAAAIKRETQTSQSGGQQSNATPAAGSAGNTATAESSGSQTENSSGGNTAGGNTGAGGNPTVSAGAAGGAATAQPSKASVRRIEVLSGTIALNADSLQKGLKSAKENALALGQDGLADVLMQAQAAAAQISLAASDLNARAKVADELTPQLAQQGQQAKAQIDSAIQALVDALSQAQAAAQNLPAGDAKAKSIRRTLEAATITTEYMRTWNNELGNILGGQ